MRHLRTINRGVRLFSTVTLKLKSKWKNLAAYITNENDALSWKELNNKVAETEKVIEKYEESELEEAKKIDWDIWKNKIGNTKLLTCMKNFYDNQMQILDNMEKREKTEKTEKTEPNENKKKEDDSEVSDLFNKALNNCKTAEQESEMLLVNGVKALWIQFHNPSVQDLDNNEWIESDLYWKAFVEKHAIYNLNNKSLEPEDEENKIALKNEWHKKTSVFNERSDTPILYDYMINLPSWEYYDINRRIFLEHLFYFLLRSGLKFQMFPELFKWKWLTHIEDLRFQFLDVAVKRKNELQLKSGKREVPLEFQPIDYEHHGEDFHLKLLQHFRDFQNIFLSRLMSNYIFLCDPFIPIQTKQSLINIQKNYQGKLYKLNNDVNCLFYLPIQEQIKEKDQFKPFEALYHFYSYLKQNNIQLNPSYSQLLYIITEILEERGKFWLKTADETLADSFLRRYNKEDNAFPIYVDYVNQMKEQFDNKIEIPIDKYKQEIEIIEEKFQRESDFFTKFVKALLNEEPFIQEEDKLQHLAKIEKKKLQKLIDSEQIHIVDADNENKRKIKTVEHFIEYIQKQELEKMEIQNFVKEIRI